MQIYQAFVLNDMPLWERVEKEMRAEYTRSPSDELLYDLLLSNYGLIGYHFSRNQRAQAEQYLTRSESLLEDLKQSADYQSESNAFEAAFWGFRIGLRPVRALVLGPRAWFAVSRALEADPSYTRAWVEKGNIMYFAPFPFGNKARAIEYYLKAIELMEADMRLCHCWLYLSTLVTLSNSYEETGNALLAIETLEKALRFEPRFIWVKDELLPELRARHADQ